MKNASSWVSLIVGLIVGLICSYVFVLSFNSSIFLSIVAGLITGGVAALIDRKNAILAGLIVTVLIVLSRTSTEVMIQLNREQDMNILQSLYAPGMIIGGLIAGIIVYYMFGKKK